MLSSSHPKIHEPLVTGVSPHPTDQRGARKLRNTRARGNPPVETPAGCPGSTSPVSAEITLKAHRGKVMRKMRVDSLADLVRIAVTLDVPRASDARY
jgi:hypothetical protein